MEEREGRRSECGTRGREGRRREEEGIKGGNGVEERKVDKTIRRTSETTRKKTRVFFLFN